MLRTRFTEDASGAVRLVRVHAELRRRTGNRPDVAEKSAVKLYKLLRLFLERHILEQSV